MARYLVNIAGLATDTEVDGRVSELEGAIAPLAKDFLYDGKTYACGPRLYGIEQGIDFGSSTSSTVTGIGFPRVEFFFEGFLHFFYAYGSQAPNNFNPGTEQVRLGIGVVPVTFSASGGRMTTALSQNRTAFLAESDNSLTDWFTATFNPFGSTPRSFTPMPRHLKATPSKIPVWLIERQAPGAGYQFGGQIIPVYRSIIAVDGEPI
jgi:hypothetical protein